MSQTTKHTPVKHAAGLERFNPVLAVYPAKRDVPGNGEKTIQKSITLKKHVTTSDSDRSARKSIGQSDVDIICPSRLNEHVNAGLTGLMLAMSQKLICGSSTGNGMVAARIAAAK